MKIRMHNNLSKREWALIIVLVLLVGWIVADNMHTAAQKERDAIRIADIRGVRAALEEYYLTYRRYPNCLYQQTGCTSLEGTGLMQTAPRDPLTGLGYNYAAFGTGKTCGAYHVGGSLERTGSQALLTGADAPPRSSKELCTGSEPDFSGLSSVPGGQPCTLTAGTPQPTTAPGGETCYDLVSRMH